MAYTVVSARFTTRQYISTVNGKNVRIVGVGCLRNEDFVRALEDHRPVSLRSVNLDAPYVEVEWSQIGGLKSIKDTLLEVVEWPVKVGH